jgi:prolipoprotein diacylglyceryltransferase
LLPALITLIAGLVLLAAAKPISNHFMLGSLGGRLIPTYALFQAGGHIAGLAIFLALTPSEFRLLYLRLVCFVLFPAAAISARAVCGITDYWPRFRWDPVDFIFRADRYSAFGGLAGALIAYAAAVAFFHVPFGLWVADAFCFGLLGGEFVSRLGCHANGCCYGKPAPGASGLSEMFTVTYRDEFQKAVWHGGFGATRIYAAPLCMSALNLAALCLLLLIAGLTQPPAGLLGGIGLMLYPYCRLVNDFLRVDRSGMGKTFTFLFLPCLFACGFVALLSTLPPATAGDRIAPDFGALGAPRVYALLAIEYLLLVFIYGAGAEFKPGDRATLSTEAGDALIRAEASVARPD